MKRPPQPRPGVFDLYWIFASRRHEIFERRVEGRPQPWTDDPILRVFKFCNVFRAADRVSQYLIREVAYGSASDSPDDRLFRIIAFRTFSKPATWRGVIARLGHEPTLSDLASGNFEEALDDTRAELGGLYTGAFILCATKAFGFNEKHKNHVALFKSMFFQAQAATRIRNAKSLAEIVRFLETFPLTGPFMSYQLAIDLNYSDIVNFDENDFTQPGPGALRGIKKAFLDLGDYSPTEVIQWMVANQDKEFNRLDLEFNGLWGRPLHAIDCQGLFCELDKYCREAAPELLSNRSRIKTRFLKSSEPMPLFFPPKWGLNPHLAVTESSERIAPKGVLGSSPQFPGFESLGRPGIHQTKTKRTARRLQRRADLL
jgi:hypothetical protein